MLIKQSSAAKALPFFMVDSTDHISGKTGLAPAVTISKNGAAFAAPSGAVSEISAGWYKIAGNATDSNTLGALLIHATATGADPYDVEHEVVLFDVDSSTVVVGTNNDKTGYSLTSAYDPAKTAAQAGAAMTLTSVYDAAKTAAAPGAAMTLTSAYDPAKSAAQVGSAMTLTPAYDSAKTASSQASVDAVDDYIDTEIGAIKAKTDQMVFTAGKIDANATTTITAGDMNAIADAVLKRDWTLLSGEAAYSALQALRMLRNIWTTAGGNLTVKKEDGTTTAWSRALATDPNAQPIVGAT